jgi:Peptidase family M28
MKSKALQCILLLLLLAPLLGQGQITPLKNPRDINQVSRTPSNGGSATFQEAANALVAGGTLTDRLVSDAEWIKKYAATITAADLEAHLRFIASDELEGRETGTRGQKVAARYLSTQFMKMGLEPGNNGEWYQTYDLNRLTLRNSTISLLGKDALVAGKDFVSFDKSAMAHEMEGEWAFAGFGIDAKNYNNLQGLNLKDKVALILSGEPMHDGKYVISGTGEASDWTSDIELKQRALTLKGAKCAVVALPDDGYQKLAAMPWLKRPFVSGALQLAYKDAERELIPMFFISESTANTLLKKAKTSADMQRKALQNSAELATLDLSKGHFSLKADATIESIKAENVLGFIEGTDKKDEIVVITAHFDHLGIQDSVIYNGADDDGTGTVALLEIAEAFMAAVHDGHRPRRSILFMPVSGEEKGLLGSEYYSDHPVYPLKKTVCDLNIDMIGRVDEKHTGEPQYIYVIGSDKLSTQLHIANESANKVISNLELDYTFNSPDDPNQFYYRSDHYNFAKHGIPVIFYFSGVHEDYHKPTDDIEKILFPRATRVAQLVFATAWEAANRDEKFVVDKKSDFKER